MVFTGYQAHKARALRRVRGVARMVLRVTTHIRHGCYGLCECCLVAVVWCDRGEPDQCSSGAEMRVVTECR